MMESFFLGEPDAQGRALVLLHGAGGNHALWGLVCRDLWERGIPAAALDLPGHGRSGGAAHASIGAYADAVRMAVQECGIRNYAVAGHSMGGAIALTLASQLRPEVEGAGVVSSGARKPVDAMILKGTLEAFDCTVENLARFCFARGTEPETLRQAAQTLTRAGSATVHADFSACADYGLSAAALAGIRIPLEVVCGELDVLTPMVLSEELVASVPGARLTRLPLCGHMPLIEDPAGLASALTRLWERSFPEARGHLRVPPVS